MLELFNMSVLIVSLVSIIGIIIYYTEKELTIKFEENEKRLCD